MSDLEQTLVHTVEVGPVEDRVTPVVLESEVVDSPNFVAPSFALYKKNRARKDERKLTWTH